MKYSIKHDRENDWWVIYNSHGKAVDAQRTEHLAKFVVQQMLEE